MSDTPKTGWPPGLLQDDDRKLSRWFSSRPDARRIVRLVALSIKQRLCKHQFRGIDMQPRDEAGMVSWSCAKCGKVYREPYGLLMGDHGEITGPWIEEGPTP